MTLTTLINKGAFYQGYTYAYPHKTAYRHFQPMALQDVWHKENKQQLFLYVHIPFCEMRCGFCNLFTTANPKQTMADGYLEALIGQIQTTKQALGDEANFNRFALGGGTPTYLTVNELEKLFNALAVFKLDYLKLPSSVETSPLTATRDRLTLLKERHLKRVSIGVQSFIESEVKSVGRGQKNVDVFRALETIKALNFPILNIDLIYGMANQSPQTWAESLQTALAFQPQEIFLYPLYVRPLTGIGKFGFSWDDERLRLYQQGRDTLLSQGYEQVSMRYFRKLLVDTADTPAYCCQQDGMIGLGCGARSYTSDLHYSFEYGVGRQTINTILDSYNRRTAKAFSEVGYGFKLDADTQRRRFILQSVLHSSGLSEADYSQRFYSDVWQDYPQLKELITLNLISEQQGTWCLTERGFELSDLIGPWFYAPDIEQRMESYQLA